jgi:hypothetical protein
MLLLACILSVGLPLATGQQALDDATAVLQAERGFHRAFLAADTNTLDTLLTAEFVWMHGDGAVWTKPKLLDEFRSGKLSYKRDDTDNVKVTTYGPRAAVVVGHDVRQYGTGEAFDFNYTTTYVKQSGAWRVAVFHSSHCPCAKKPPLPK